MNPISLKFDSEILEDLKNLYRVLGYIRGRNFPNVEQLTATTIDPKAWTYINALQKQHGLKVVQQLNKETILLINDLFAKKQSKKDVVIAAPTPITKIPTTTVTKYPATATIATTITTSPTYQVKGVIRDANWQTKSGVTIEVFEQGMREQTTLLAKGETDKDGSYTIDYAVPIHPKTKKEKETVHLLVKATFSESEIKTLTFYKAEKLTQADFTAGDRPYEGPSVFEERLELITCALGDLKILEVEESGKNKDVSFLNEETGLVKDDIMKVLLAHHISAAFKGYDLLTPALVYGFLYQDSPNNLPSYLLPLNLNDWNIWLELLLAELTKGLVLSNTALQETVLKKSIRENIVPVQTSLNYEKSMEQLAQIRKDYALKEALIADKIALNDLLVLTALPKDSYETVATTFSQIPSFENGFLDRLISQENIKEEHIKELKTAKTLANITNYHLPLIQIMHNSISPKQKAVSEIQRLSDFAKWEKGHWLEFIKGNEIPLPADIFIEDEAQKLDAYAQTLYNNTVKTYPVVALVAQSSKSDLNQLKSLPKIAEFLDKNQTFQLQTDHVDIFNKENPKVLTKDMIAEIKVLKRINNIAPSPEAGTALLNKQIHSAGQVYGMGKAALTSLLADSKLPDTTIDQIYNISSNQYADALALASQYGFNQQNPKAIISLVEAVNNPKNPLSSQISGLPDLETLFGSMDYCECQHCKSVYSPAAYFTDILRFLSTKPLQSSSLLNLKTALIERRPDLDDIGLNCENAHKPLPYIDLVCEVLENTLSTHSYSRNFAHNTTLSAEELRAIPQYVRAEAYELLAKESPINSHFNLWLAEAHLFLAHLGVPYHQLMATWQHGNIPNDAAIAAAYFEIYSNEAKWILNVDGIGHPPSLIFVYSNNEMEVNFFLDRTKTTYNQLIELLQLEWLNPADQLTVIERPVNSCAIDDQILKNHLTATKLDRIHRFLRLSKHTDWEMWELDLLIRNPKIGNGVLDGNCLVKLQKFHQLQEQFKLSVEELIPFYENLDITNRRDHLNKEIAPFYKRLFLNPAVDNPNFVDFDIQTVSTTASINQTHSYTVSAVLGIDETVVFSLLNTPTSATTGLDILSEIYRKVVLAKQLDLSVEQMNTLAFMSGVYNPFDSLEATLQLLDYKQKTDRNKLSINTLSYLLTNNDSVLEINDLTISNYLEQQRQAMLDLKDDLFNTAEPTKDLLKRHLAKVPAFLDKDNKIQEAIDLIFSEGKWAPPVPVLGPPGSNPLPAPLSPQPFINQYFDFVRNNNTALTILNTNSTTASVITAKVNYVLNELQYFLNKLLVKVEATKNVGLSEDSMNLLLNLSNSNGAKLLTVLRDEYLITLSTSTTYNNISYNNYPAQFEAYRLLHKMQVLVNTWNLNAFELNDFISHYGNNQFDILHLNTLPIKSATTQAVAPNLFEKLLNCGQFVLLNKEYTVTEEFSISQIWNNTTLSDLLDDLSLWTGWDRTLLNDISLHSHLALSLNDFYSIETYVLLQNRIQQQKALGVQVSLIYNWIERDGTSGLSINDTLSYQQAIANQIKKAAKAKYQKEEWLSILKPIQDVLREKKRSALVKYFILHTAFGKTPNELFQYFLIDVEMSACQMTSRLKQAISSAQLFTQRILMNLEPNIQSFSSGSEDHWNQWKWMKNYRVWEANRKVFLYPENWIEPELRDDKSPFFEELENDLLQNEITHENVEAAFGRYLHKVDAVANIDVMGMCEGLGANDEILQHVLGRTKEVPGNYFFRSYNETYSSWSAWEAVDVGITGNHAVPAVFNGKVYIFWLEIMEKPSKSNKMPANETTTEPTDVPENIPVLEIQLAWTVRKNDGWASKKISSKKLIHPWPRPYFSFHLRPKLITRPGSDTSTVPTINATEFWIDLFVSDSREFNNKKFYDEYTGDFNKLANSEFSEAHRPWHSSSFVFDGGRVQSVKLLGLVGDYYLPEELIEQPKVASLGPLQITQINFTPSGGTDWVAIRTNYGHYHYYDNDSTSKASNLAAINQKIKETRAAHLPDVTIQNLVRYATWHIHVVTNKGTYLSNHLGLLNNIIATGSLLHATNYTIQSTDHNLTDSYTYVNNSFEANGRAIEPLANDKGIDFHFIHGMKYEYNHLTNTTTNLSALPFGVFDYPLLNKALPPFRLVIPMKDATPVTWAYHNSFYQDEKRAFFIQSNASFVHLFSPFYHPYTDMFISELNKQGTDGLLKRNVQLYPESYHNTGYNFSDYAPDSVYVQHKQDTDIVDFSQDGAYASYNWEIFFHIPLMIATQLSNNQRFEESMRWFHYIFDPTNTEASASTSAPQQYWMTKPFYEFNSNNYQEQTINTILNDISSYQQQVVAWKNNPFMPHLVARHRPVAYQRNVVMKYIDNLIAWGDQLFRRETIESLNQATLLYVLAHELLGDRPVEIANVPINTKTYEELEDVAGGIDYFGNAQVLIAAEGLIASSNSTSPVSGQIPVFRTNYFCTPNNEKLTGYWDLVEDRLFKIRHCMNIDGLVRQLPLFAPPIDPALLVNAAAMGLDFGSVLDNLAVARSHYRFRVLSRTAAQFCSEVKSLGQSLLSALQAKDSEGMALLQSSNTIKILDTTTQIKELQIEESKENLESLKISKASTTIRKNFYESREFMNALEAKAMNLNKGSITRDEDDINLSIIASIVAYIPDTVIGVSGAAATPVSTLSIGGTQFSRSLSTLGNISAKIGGIMQKSAGLATQSSSYKRRQEEWDLQVELATKELEQIEKQIAASQIRLAIAEKDLNTHKLQIENAKSEEEYLKTKYTNKQLYSWMVSQTSAVYFQAYQLAFDMAKRAEKSLRYELALPADSSSYVKFGYWDSLKKGLLSGDKLMLAINKMEAAYLEQNKREFELTKQISLRQLAPTSLLQLITTGECTIEMPEWWFDMDFPGHYLRRIKALSVSIPCIVGPYTNVNCSLTLEKNDTRHSAIYTDYTDVENIHTDFSSVETVAISHGQNDSGLFELNFNDERYLPFEGAGVISRWKLKLSNVDLAQFDLTSITDVVFHMRYMARNGGTKMADDARTNLKANLNATNLGNTQIMLSLKQHFSTAWHRFIHPDTASGNHELSFKLDEKHFPYLTKFGNGREIISGALLINTRDESPRSFNFTITNSASTISPLTTYTVSDNQIKPLVVESSDLNDLWTFEITNITSGTFEDIDDVILVLNYQLNIPT